MKVFVCPRVIPLSFGGQPAGWVAGWVDGSTVDRVAYSVVDLVGGSAVDFVDGSVDGSAAPYSQVPLSLKGRL